MKYIEQIAQEYLRGINKAGAAGVTKVKYGALIELLKNDTTTNGAD